MFDWNILRFRPAILLETAFASPTYHQTFKNEQNFTREEVFRDFVQEQINTTLQKKEHSFDKVSGALILFDLKLLFATLYQLVLFRYSNWILLRLVAGNHLPQIKTSVITKEEASGYFGLSYGLIKRASGYNPLISLSRAGGGKAARGGFSDFPNDWRTRIQLLFDWDDGFRRVNWETHPHRLWARFCYDRIRANIGVPEAEAWRQGIGLYGTPWLTVLPRYEADKPFQLAKIPKGISEKTRLARLENPQLNWQATMPINWEEVLAKRLKGRKYTPLNWKLLEQGDGIRGSLLLPQIYLAHLEIVNGRRFDLIDKVMGILEDNMTDI
ncbi:MAG: hypothetical protein ACRYGR_02145 [Janthinobacterium lividum]